MSKKTTLPPHEFKPTIFASRDGEGEDRYVQYFDNEDGALSEDGVEIEGQDAEVGLVAEYKLVRVRMVRFDNRIVEVK